MTLLSKDASIISKVRLKGDVVTDPPNIVAREIDNSSEESVTLGIGFFNPGDSISLLPMMDLGVESAELDEIIGAETRIPGLSRPNVTSTPQPPRYFFGIGR